MRYSETMLLDIQPETSVPDSPFVFIAVAVLAAVAIAFLWSRRSAPRKPSNTPQ